jgi:hypothetical protein
MAYLLTFSRGNIVMFCNPALTKIGILTDITHLTHHVSSYPFPRRTCLNAEREFLCRSKSCDIELQAIGNNNCIHGKTVGSVMRDTQQRMKAGGASDIGPHALTPMFEMHHMARATII